MMSFCVLLFVIAGVYGTIDKQTDDVESRYLLSSRLDQIEDFLRHQDAKLSRQEILIRQLNAEVTHQNNQIRLQDNLIRQLEDDNTRQNSMIRQLISKLLHQEASYPQQKDIPTHRPRSQTNDSGQGRRRISSSHDVTARTDDWGALEAVVSHVSQKVTEMDADIQAYKAKTSADVQMLKTSSNQQAHAIEDAQSSIFIQWGSSTCGADSQLVYSGFVGGSHYSHTGAATNFLCLTMSPVFSNHATNDRYLAYLYGAEYDTFDSHFNQDAVCAVCRSTFTTTVMVPGTNVCTSGWHRQYSGYLMAGRHDEAAGSEYICVDSKFDSSVGGNREDNDAVLYFTKTRCGSLPCMPYVNDKVVTCAVCSM